MEAMSRGAIRGRHNTRRELTNDPWHARDVFILHKLRTTVTDWLLTSKFRGISKSNSTNRGTRNEVARVVRAVILLVTVSILSACVALNLRPVTFQGTSMLPTLKDGDSLTVMRLDEESRTRLTRGDIVVFKFPPDQTKRYIKRVIGLSDDRCCCMH